MIGMNGQRGCSGFSRRAAAIALLTIVYVLGGSVEGSSLPLKPHESRAGSDTVNLVETWKVAFMGSGIGNTGMVTVDIDLDNVLEVICSGSTTTFGTGNYWYVLEYKPDGSTYEMKWISPMYDTTISRICAVDRAGNGQQSVLVGLSNGELIVYGGMPLNEERRMNLGCGRIYQILLADADNDSSDEIIVLGQSQTLVLDPTTFTQEVSLPFTGYDLEVGNVDGDPANEIVFGSGVVIELNGATYETEWTHTDDFGYILELSDIDSDGILEIVAAESWYYISAFDADLASAKWEYRTSHDIDALLMADTNGDGQEEMLYGDGQWGEVYCLDPTGAGGPTLMWSIDNPEHGVTSIAVGDVDGDDELEVLFGAGASSTGEDHLYVHDVATRNLEWASKHLDGPVHAIDVGDTNGDGRKEIVFVSFTSNSDYADGVVRVYDYLTHDLLWESPTDLFSRHAWTGVHDVKIGDVDDDGQAEIVVATDKLYDGAIYVLNGSTFALEASYLYDDGAPMYRLQIGDVDNDGDTEIVAGAGRAHSGAPGVYIYVIDGKTGVTEWHSVTIGANWSNTYGLELADIDGNGVLDVVATNDRLYIIDGVSHQMWSSQETDLWGLDLCDMDGDGGLEVLAGTGDGRIHVYQGDPPHGIMRTLDVSGYGKIWALRGFDMIGDGAPEVTYAHGRNLTVVNGQNGQVLGRADNLASEAAAWNALIVDDFDSDGHADVLAGTSYGVTQFVEAGGISPDPLLIIPISEMQTTEWGGTARFQLALASAPNEPVQVGLLCLNESEGLLDREQHTFDSTNFADPVTIVVTGQDDPDPDGPIPYTVTVSMTSDDSRFNRPWPRRIDLVNVDNDGLVVEIADGVSALQTTETGLSHQFTVRFAYPIPPGVSVEVPVVSSDLGEGRVNRASVMMTEANWFAGEQITVNGMDDLLADGKADYNVSVGPAICADPLYDNMRAVDVQAVNYDNELIVADPEKLDNDGLIRVNESGATCWILVRLAEPLPEDVFVDVPVTLTDPTEGRLSQTVVTFAQSNNEDGVWVFVGGLDDAEIDGDVPFAVQVGPGRSSSPFFDWLTPVTLLAVNGDNDQVVDTGDADGEPVGLLASSPMARPSPACVGMPVMFWVGVVGANDATVVWDFGDGITAAGYLVTHTYSTSGQFDVTVQVAGAGQVVTESLQFTVYPRLQIDSFRARISGAANDRDFYTLRGVVPGMPAGFAVGGKTAEFLVGGLSATFQLNEKGVHAIPNEKARFKLKTSRANGSQTLCFTARVRGPLADIWSAYGVSADVATNGLLERPMQVFLVLDGQTYGTEIRPSIKSKAGRGAKLQWKQRRR